MYLLLRKRSDRFSKTLCCVLTQNVSLACISDYLFDYISQKTYSMVDYTNPIQRLDSYLPEDYLYIHTIHCPPIVVEPGVLQAGAAPRHGRRPPGGALSICPQRAVTHHTTTVSTAHVHGTRRGTPELWFYYYVSNMIVSCKLLTTHCRSKRCLCFKVSNSFMVSL